MIVPCANPACKAPTEREDLIAGLCSRCLANGAPIPLAGSDELTERNLTRGDVQRTPFDAQHFPKHSEKPPRAVEREEPMANLKACRYCGKEMPKGSLFRHEHVMCEQRPRTQTPASEPGGPTIRRAAKKPRTKYRAEAPPTVPAVRNAPARILRIVREPGTRVQTVDDVRSAIEQLISDCQTTLATLAMMDALAARRTPPPAA